MVYLNTHVFVFSSIYSSFEIIRNVTVLSVSKLLAGPLFVQSEQLSSSLAATNSHQFYIQTVDYYENTPIQIY